MLLAAGIAFFVIPRFYNNQKSTVSVVRPTQEIAAGTVIKEAMVSSTEIGAYGLPERIAKESGEVVGKVALESIHAGEFFWLDSLTTEEDYKAVVDANIKGLKDGYCLVTIKCSSASVGVAGVLRPGNTVDVFECVEDTETDTYSTVKALDDMYVYDTM